MQRRIERYLDQGYGESFLRDPQVATMIQTDLLSYDEKTLKLSAWVVMPNHIHLLLTHFEDHTLAGVMQSLKSLSSHKANKILKRSGPFWMADYFDRYIRDGKHFAKTIHYIETIP
jgi:REP element-mobilizing transposase RayT